MIQVRVFDALSIKILKASKGSEQTKDIDNYYELRQPRGKMLQ